MNNITKDDIAYKLVSVVRSIFPPHLKLRVARDNFVSGDALKECREKIQAFQEPNSISRFAWEGEVGLMMRYDNVKIILLPCFDPHPTLKTRATAIQFLP